MAKSMQSNPMMVTKVGSILEAVKSMGGITTGVAKVVTALPPVFSAAKIDAKFPTTSKSEAMTVPGGV